MNLSYEGTGTVFEIERYALNDGPGIRTIVFLKGCPLSCRWCANPESQAPEPQLMHNRQLCIGCGACLPACPYGALSEGTTVDYKRCTGCGNCAEVCATGALSISGERMSADDVAKAVLRDSRYYDESGGGLTFSGGEPLMQLSFIEAVVKKLSGVHVCMETSGFATHETIEKASRAVNHFLFDLKLMDSKAHEEYIGIPNELILDNFRYLAKHAKITARFPVIPGINDTEANIKAMIAFLKETAPGIRVDLMPYHRLGAVKYARLGMDYGLKGLLPASNEYLRSFASLFEQSGFEVCIGG